MRVTYDRDADAAYIYVSDKPVARTVVLDDNRFLDVDDSGILRGIEFLSASAGVRVADLPVRRQALESALLDNGIPLNDSFALQSVNLDVQSLGPDATSYGAAVTASQWNVAFSGEAIASELREWCIVDRTSSVRLPGESWVGLAESA